jgi:putative membrane protein
MRLLLTWIINAAALMALPYLMHSVTVTSFGAALIAALVLGLVNTLVINGFLFWGVAQMVNGFHVAGFWSAMLAAILYSVISWALTTLLLRNDGNQ